MRGFRLRPKSLLSTNQGTLAVALKATVLTVTALAVFYQDLVMIFDDALQNEATSYLLIVPFLLAYLIYRKRKMIKASVALDSPRLWKLPINEIVGALLLLSSFLLYWYGSYTFTPLEYHILALPIFVSACVLVLFNVQTLRQLLFPVLFLFLLVPPPAEILYNVGSLLSTASSELAYGLLQVLSFPATLNLESGTPMIYVTSQSGDVIQLAVDVACSGIYSQIGFLVFALFIAYIIRDKIWKKSLVLILGFPLIYLLNVLRITIIGIIGFYYGEAIVLNLFHLLGGWILIFTGTFFLLVVSEKVLKVQILSKPPQGCQSCRTVPSATKDFCLSCGRILKVHLPRISKRDVGKVACLILSVSMILSIQAPVFALTQGPAEIILQSAQGGNVTTHILPEFPGYTLRFLYRDEEFRQLAKQDASLVYAYIPDNKTKEMVWVAVEIASTKTSLHRWETCLITWPVSHGRQPRVNQIELRDIQLLQNPPIIGRYFVFNSTATNETQAVLYWYETSVFKINSTSQQKQVKISLIAYPNGTTDLPDVGNQLLALASQMVGYWQPIKTWSQIALVISQNGDRLIALTMAALAGTCAFYAFEMRKKRRQNAVAYQKLSKTDMLLVDAVHEAGLGQLPTLNALSSLYNRKARKALDEEKLLEKLSKTEAIGIIRTEIAGRYDEPTQVWRVEVPFPKERLTSRLRKHINLRRFRAKNRA